MGRLLAIGLLVVAAGVTAVVVNGPGTDKPDEMEARVPASESSRGQAVIPDEEIAPSDPAQPGIRVRMRRLRFVPEAVTARVGQSVRFVNDDSVAHTVLEDVGATSGKNTAVDSARIAPGETFTFTPTEEGVVPFVCTLHPTVMKGQVLVEPDAA